MNSDLSSKVNTYIKICPNVWGALCEGIHNKGDIIKVANRKGKEREHLIHNFYCNYQGKKVYSITRADGVDSRKYAEMRADRRMSWAEGQKRKSDEFYERSNKDHDFLSLGEPIKIGHHSERRHRRLFEQVNNNTRKSIESDEKAARHEEVAQYWEEKSKIINLSMPESLEYFPELLEKLRKKKVDVLERGREHHYEIAYINRDILDTRKKIKRAERLWGDQK